MGLGEVPPIDEAFFTMFCGGGKRQPGGPILKSKEARRQAIAELQRRVEEARGNG